MIVSIVSEDNTVTVDGVSTVFDFTSLISPDIRAVQWDGKVGEIEYREERRPNEKITKFKNFQPIVSAIPSALASQRLEKEQKEADRIANLPYNKKRQREYPFPEEQLGAIWEVLESISGAIPVGSEADIIFNKIKAIKIKYPKP